jgi:hypothetical protein
MAFEIWLRVGTFVACTTHLFFHDGKRHRIFAKVGARGFCVI